MRARLSFVSAIGAMFLHIGAAYAQDAQPSPVLVDEAKGKEADAFIETWNEKGKELCEDNAPGCAAAGLSLVRAAELYCQAGMRNKAIVTRLIILDPRYHLDYTDYGKKAHLLVGNDYQSIGEYERAATSYESFAQKFPAMDEGPTALADAVVFRYALGDMGAAQRDIEQFAKAYGLKKRDELAKLYYSFAATHEEKGRFAEAREVLKKQLSFLDKAAPIDIQMRAHALMGRLLAADGKMKEAASEYQFVRDLYEEPAQVIAKLKSRDGDENSELRRLAKVLDAVGEAIFFAAEQKRAAIDAMRPPTMIASEDTKAIIKHINTKMAKWALNKRVAIEEAERAYTEILSLQPVPPPRWVIASASALGQMWGTFASEFRRAPVPKNWAEETRTLYFAALDDAAAPIKAKAFASFRLCSEYSVKYQWFDSHWKTCDAWLGKYDRKRHVTVSEFIPSVRPAPLFLPATPAPMPEILKK